MRGLLTKDFCLLAGQKRFWIVVLGIAALFMVSGQNEMFVIAYVTMLCAFFSISTIHYDEFNKADNFLFTLPFERKEYVIEKYVFGMIIGGAAWLVSTVVGFIAVSMKNQGTDMTEWILEVVTYLLVLLLMLSFMIPIELKFGAEKGRIASFAIFFVIFGICFLGGELAEKFEIDVVGTLNGIDNRIFTGVLVAAAVVAFIISLAASIKIMEKKQF